MITKAVLSLLLSITVVILLFPGKTVAFDDQKIKAAILKEISSDPGLNSNQAMLKVVKVEVNNGYVLISADCVQYATSQSKNVIDFAIHKKTCNRWLKGAAETASIVPGIKKITLGVGNK